MKLDRSFVKWIGYYLIGIAVSIYVLSSYVVGTGILNSMIASAAMGLMHLFIGYFLIELGFDKKNTTFLKIVLGGMAARLFLMATLFLVLIRAFHFHVLSLIMSLLLFYVINLVLEISFLQKKVSVKNRT